MQRGPSGPRWAHSQVKGVHQGPTSDFSSLGRGDRPVVPTFSVAGPHLKHLPRRGETRPYGPGPVIPFINGDMLVSNSHRNTLTRRCTSFVSLGNPEEPLFDELSINRPRFLAVARPRGQGVAVPIFQPNVVRPSSGGADPCAGSPYIDTGEQLSGRRV